MLYGLQNPETFWLTVVNITMGAATAAFVLALIGVCAYVAVKTLRRQAVRDSKVSSSEVEGLRLAP